MDNETLRVLRTRRSIRHFKSDPVSREALETVLEAGTYAPTGHGTQEPWIVAVLDPDLQAELREMNAALLGTDKDPYYGAPVIVLVFADPSIENAVKDGSLVLGNMMNAAHSIGLGSCWINREDKMFAREEGKKILRRFNLPEDVIGIGALALGYPSRPAREAAPRKEGYWRIIG